MRSILYYPTVSIPYGVWLRQSVLYWDQVSSICPEPESRRLPSTLRFLEEEGIYRPVYPESLIENGGNWAHFEALCDEFQRALDGVAPSGRSRAAPLPVYRGKVSHQIAKMARDRGLILHDDGRHLYFEAGAARTYMSLLAKYLASIDVSEMAIGTSAEEWEAVAWQAGSLEPSLGAGVVTQLIMRDVLPVPFNCDLVELIEFKSRNEADLLRLRRWVDQLVGKIGTAKSREEVKRIVGGASEELSLALADLSDKMHSVGFDVRWSTLKALIDAKVPGLAQTLGVATTAAVAGASVPAVVAGAVVVGAVQVGAGLHTLRTQQQAALQASPFSYVYRARNDGFL